MTAKNIALSFLIFFINDCFALNINDTSRFKCKSGNCVNGQGVVFDAYMNVEMSGEWLNGETIEGKNYFVTTPFSQRKFSQIFGKDGYIEKGEQPRYVSNILKGNTVPFFNGLFHQVNHPFIRQNISIFYDGEYDTGNGIRYRGRFEYLAAKTGMDRGLPSGTYIFYGEKIDEEENEVESGLYISDEALWNNPIHFLKADPSYLEILERAYQKDMEFAIGEFRQRESSNKWKHVLKIIGNVAVSMAATQMQQAGVGSKNTITNVLNIVQGDSVSLDTIGKLGSGDLSDVVLKNIENKKTNNIAVKLVLDVIHKKDIDIDTLAEYAINSEVKDPKLNKILVSAIRDNEAATSGKN